MVVTSQKMIFPFHPCTNSPLLLSPSAPFHSRHNALRCDIYIFSDKDNAK